MPENPPFVPSEPATSGERRLALLHSVSIFEFLDEEDLRELAANLQEHHYRAGELVISQGDEGDEMFIVASGQLNIFIPGEESRRVSLKDIGRGECFGELALFDKKPRSASVLATTDAELLALSGETLLAFLEHKPRAALSILRTIAERLRDTTVLLSQRAAKNAVKEVEENLTWSARIADKVAELNGSWSFILGLLVLTGGWTALNVPGILGRPFDPFPYVFFNLLLAILVAIQGPLIVMSQNRQALKERAQADTDFRVNLKNEVNIETILRELGEMRAELGQRLENLENLSETRRENEARGHAGGVLL